MSIMLAAFAFATTCWVVSVFGKWNATDFLALDFDVTIARARESQKDLKLALKQE